MRARLVAGLIAAASTACFDGRVDDGASVSCSANDECPEGTGCVTAIGRCVPLGAGDDVRPVVSVAQAPTVIRAATSAADRLVRFTVNEPLAAPPVVRAGGVALDVVVDGELVDAVFVVDVDPAVVGEGDIDVTAVLVDAVGNVDEVSVVAIVIDVTPPDVIELVAPARVRDAPFVVAVIGTERLQGVTLALSGDELASFAQTFRGGDSASAAVDVAAVLVPAKVPPDAPDLPRRDVTLVIDALTLTDGVGNTVTREFARPLVVDTAGPAVTVRAVRGRASNVTPNNEFVVEVDVVDGDAAAALVSIEVGGLPMSCVGALPAVCRGATAAGLVRLSEGVHAVTAVAIDTVGNSGVAGGTVVVDRTPPTLTGAITLRGPNGGPLSGRAVGFGGFINVVLQAEDFDLDGAVAAVRASVHLRGPSGAEVPFANVAENAAELEVTDVLASGDYEVVASAVDVLGNAGETVLGSVAVSSLTPSPCVADGPAGPRCTDFDGDGVLGVSDSCDVVDVAAAGSAVDCDDSDALVWPGMIEIPGDRLDNDCVNGDADLAADAVAAVFVTVDGDPLAEGTRQRPTTLAAGITRGRGLGLPVFVAAGTYRLDAVSLGGGVIVGGFDPSTFEPRAGPTVVEHTGDRALLLDGAGLVGVIDVDFAVSDHASVVTTTAPRAVFGRLGFVSSGCVPPDGCGAFITSAGSAIVVDVVGAGDAVTPNAQGFDLVNAFAVDVDVSDIDVGVDSAGALQLARSRVVANVGVRAATLALLDTVVVQPGDSGVGVTVAGATQDWLIAHSAILGPLAPRALTVSSGRAKIINSVLIGDAQPGVLIADGSATLSLGATAIRETCIVASCVEIDDVNAANCGPFATCVDVGGGNFAIVAGDVDADGALLEVRPGLPLLDAPTTLAGDRNGDCRDLAAPRVGP